MEVKKTKEEVKKMIETLRKSIDELPERNMFGGSNELERDEMIFWLRQLVLYHDEGKLSNDPDVQYWLLGKGHSALDDFSK